MTWPRSGRSRGRPRARTRLVEPLAPPVADPDGKRSALVPLLPGPAGRAEGAETWTVRFGEVQKGKPALERAGDRGERIAFVGPDGRWEVQVNPAPRAAEEVAAAVKVARRTFAESDGDADGKLDAVELERPAALGLKFLVPFADRDGDGKLARAELDSWLDLQSALVKGVVVLGVTNLGCGLFELLDADRDGALSVRELRSAASRARAAGALKNGVVVKSQFPRHVVVVVTRGRPLSELVVPIRLGPAWFRAMDRNGDGDVSAAEFLGPVDEFKRLDADGDGLLSPDEAIRAESRR